MNTLQDRRRAALVRQYASLADQRDATIAKLCRIAAKLATVRRQLGRYEKLKANRTQAGELPASWHDIELPALEAPDALPPNGDALPKHLSPAGDALADILRGG